MVTDGDERRHRKRQNAGVANASSAKALALTKALIRLALCQSSLPPQRASIGCQYAQYLPHGLFCGGCAALHPLTCSSLLFQERYHLP